MLLFSASLVHAGVIKVLILDDTFRNVPPNTEKIEKMGRLSGDLLVNGTHYVGNIEVWKGTEGMYLINELPLEEYVKNVVNAEVAANWDMEALKAQAVIARTYALYQKNGASNLHYDITSSVLHQVYKGSVIDARISYAVMTTEAEVLTYEGKLIEALYHSTCGGRTEDAAEVFGKSYPYMRPVESNCEISPYWIWERKIPLDEIEKALKLSGIKEITISSYTSTGRVKTVAVVHDGGTTTVKATDLRKLLGWNRLPSTNFTITRENDQIVCEGKGYGHGVGLCQWSALKMAQEGKNYREILSFFYPGTTIQLYEDR
jgi:stage II sporulation protein D (peptidoglycan lytic transglycosylase)